MIRVLDSADSTLVEWGRQQQQQQQTKVLKPVLLPTAWDGVFLALRPPQCSNLVISMKFDCHGSEDLLEEVPRVMSVDFHRMWS